MSILTARMGRAVYWMLKRNQVFDVDKSLDRSQARGGGGVRAQVGHPASRRRRPRLVLTDPLYVFGSPGG